MITFARFFCKFYIILSRKCITLITESNIMKLCFTFLLYYRFKVLSHRFLLPISFWRIRTIFYIKTNLNLIFIHEYRTMENYKLNLMYS